MTRTRTAVLIVFPVIAACSEQASTAPGESPIAPSSAATVLTAKSPRPFGGRCTTALTLVPPVPDDPPNVLRLHIEYVCQLAHLGRTTAIAEQVVVFTSESDATASNTTTYTAANGDQLFSTWTGTSKTVGADISFSGPETYAGGTGRFSNASGNAWISGTASFATNTGQFTSVGILSY